MVFVPNDFSSSYVVTHWTDPSNFLVYDTAPMSQSLINSTQILPAPTSKDQQAGYAASPDTLVQIDSNEDIYYLTNAVNNYAVQSGASWSKLGYTLTGVAGGSSTNTSSSAAASGSASASASGSGASAAASGASRTSAAPSGSRSSGAASAASSTGAAMRTISGIRGLEVVDVMAGLFAVGAAVVL